MNIEAYNLDSLRKLVRALQAENKELRELLEKAEKCDRIEASKPYRLMKKVKNWIKRA